MKRILSVSLCLVWSLTCGITWGGENAPQKIVDYANSELMNIGTDPVLVQAVRQGNAKGQSLSQIKEMDEEWKGTAGIADYMQAMMDNNCSTHLRQLQDSNPYFAEIFVMDNQGANVCMTDKTSDYWQGDEDKFIESYKNGKGAVHIGSVKFDDSTQTYLVQVSVPVRDGDAVIGAVTLGIDVDKFEQNK
jgi:hypothetical protein